MNTYLIHFAVYAFAMVGFLFIVLYIYKKSIYNCANNNNKNYIKVENSLKLSPSKTLYVIRAGEEKFLIAGDSTSTTMLSKLENNKEDVYIEDNKTSSKLTEISTLKKYTTKISKG